MYHLCALHYGIVLFGLIFWTNTIFTINTFLIIFLLKHQLHLLIPILFLIWVKMIVLHATISVDILNSCSYTVVKWKNKYLFAENFRLSYLNFNGHISLVGPILI
jgi:hypothetical protein